MKRKAGIMIDLSFLTKEEQDCILAVLKRDAELKQAEERRIETLQNTVSDKSQLKFLTGEWFYETKQLRHQDRIHGSDIIIASMADRRHQPLTTMTASYAKSSIFTHCENTEEIFPPEPETSSNEFQYSYKTEQNNQAGLQSPLKKRENPFDEKLALKKQDPQSVDAGEDQPLTQKGDVCEQCYFEPIIPAASSCVSALEELEKHPFPAKARSSPDERCVQSPEDSSALEHSSESAPHILPPKYESGLQRDVLRKKEEPLELEQTACAPAEDKIEKKSYKQEVQSTQISQVRSLQLAVLQNRPFKETLTSLEVDNQQEESKSQAQVIKRKANLKTSWMTESFDSSSTGQEGKREVRTKIVHFYSIHKNPNVKNNSFSPQTGNQEDTADRSKEKDKPSQMENDKMQEDGTYRADPVFIYEDDSVLATELKITEPEDSQGVPEHLMDKKHTSLEEAFSSSIFNNNPVFSEKRETPEEDRIDQNNSKEFPRPDGSQMSSFRGVEAQEPDTKTNTERSPKFIKLPVPKSKDNFDKMRKSPSKTYHPKVLPQESPCTKESRLIESPMKTFPIDFVPNVKVAREAQEKMKSDSKQESFSPVRKQRELINTNIGEALSSSRSKKMRTSYSLPLQLDQRANDNSFETSFGRRRNTNSSISDMSFSSDIDSVFPMSSSLNSICPPADVRDTEVQGSIQFALTYIQKLGEFQIFVVLCRGLAVADPKKTRTDPYVKCSLLPDKTKLGKKKTPVKKKTINPTFNEVLGFKIPMEVLKTQHLNVTVSHKDMFGRSSYLGEVDLDLSVWDFSNTQINEYPLKAKAPVQVLPVSTSTMSSRGEMRVALRFLQQLSQSSGASRIEMGEVQIWVKDCKNLLPVRGSMINPFVKCTVLPDMSSKSQQKTRVVKRTANPMFNHTMVYDGFRLEDLREICVEITVWDQDHLKNYYIGGLRLGLGTGRSYEVAVVWMDSTAHEVHLWNRMLKANGEWVEEVLPLRLLLGAANSMPK